MQNCSQVVTVNDVAIRTAVRIQTICYTDFGPNNRHILLCGKWRDKSKFWATSENRSVLKLKSTTTNHLEVFMRK